MGDEEAYRTNVRIGELTKKLAELEARVAKLEAVNQAELEQHAAEQQQDFSFGQGEDSC